MSVVASTEPAVQELTPVEEAAARGDLPDWACASPTRREHMSRVATLLESWGRRLELSEVETLRWAAVGWLHDALRDEDPELLRREVPAVDRELPGPMLHGPAAAGRLEGSVDARLVTAIRFHTVGSPRLDRLGRALFLADFLEPGRDFSVLWRADLNKRMPEGMDEVLLEVVGSRMAHLIERRKPIHPETSAFWSA